MGRFKKGRRKYLKSQRNMSLWETAKRKTHDTTGGPSWQLPSYACGTVPKNTVCRRLGDDYETRHLLPRYILKVRLTLILRRQWPIPNVARYIMTATWPMEKIRTINHKWNILFCTRNYLLQGLGVVAHVWVISYLIGSLNIKKKLNLPNKLKITGKVNQKISYFIS